MQTLFMKQKIFKALPAYLRLLTISFLLAVPLTFIYSFKILKSNDDVWKLLGTTKEAGNEAINMSFVQGYLFHYSAKNLKNIAIGNRSAIAKDLLGYTKQYINSENFKNQYAKIRHDAKPAEPLLKAPRTIEQIQKEAIADLEKTIRETESSMKQASADVKKAMEPGLAFQKKQLQEYHDPNNKMLNAILQDEKYNREKVKSNYEEDIKIWEERYPAEPKILVRKRLLQVIEYTRDVDFNAELVEKFGKKRFVNPAYELKRSEWKQAFRAGKDVTEASRAFAAEWLKELN